MSQAASVFRVFSAPLLLRGCLFIRSLLLSDGILLIEFVLRQRSPYASLKCCKDGKFKGFEMANMIGECRELPAGVINFLAAQNERGRESNWNGLEISDAKFRAASYNHEMSPSAASRSGTQTVTPRVIYTLRRSYILFQTLRHRLTHKTSSSV